MNEEIFTKEFIVCLQGKVPDECLKTIEQKLTMFCSHFQISRVTTELALSTPFPVAYKTYMATKKIEGLSAGTLQQYKLRLEPFLLSCGKELQDITTNDIRAYLYKFQEMRGIGNHTLDTIRLNLNAFFSWCAKEGYVTRNVCAAVGPIKYEEKPRTPLSDIQLEKLRVVCKNVREKAMLETFYATGCRCSELRNLKRSDMDFITREVPLFGKGAKHRTSYMNARGLVSLQEYLATRKDDNDALFVSVRKPYRGLGNGGIEKIIRNIGKRAGINVRVCPHKIRHTFATDAVEHGMPITHLQKLLGHETISTTMIYAEIAQEQVKSSHQKYIV